MPALMQHINEGKPSTVPGVETFVQQAIANLEMAHDAIIEAEWYKHTTQTKNEMKGKPSKLKISYISPW
jgi:hypothetical protein